MKSNLPPIDTDQEKQYDAQSFEKEVVFQKCSHVNAVYNREKGELRCPCGVAFVGPNLHALERALKGIDKK